jgi:hypothetical protein
MKEALNELKQWTSERLRQLGTGGCRWTQGHTACGQCAVIRIMPDPASLRRVTYWSLQWEERWAWFVSTFLSSFLQSSFLLLVFLFILVSTRMSALQYNPWIFRKRDNQIMMGSVLWQVINFVSWNGMLLGSSPSIPSSGFEYLIIVMCFCDLPP